MENQIINQNFLLTWIVFLPIIGMVAVLIVPHKFVRHTAMLCALATLVLSLQLFPYFSGPAEEVFGSQYSQGIQLVNRYTWIDAAGFNIEYYLGVDGLSFPLVILTTVIGALACLASWNIKQGQRGYFCLFLLLQTGMLGVFLSLDFFLFYVFWELMLLPMYFLIGVWGGPRKEYAAMKFFIYTLVGSVLMLIVMLWFYFASDLHGAHTFDLIAMTQPGVLPGWLNHQTMYITCFILLFIAFAIKIPVFPFHTWLPDAHVEAPTPISMILAGVLLKMGAYGLLRISYPILPEAGTALGFAWALGILGVINIIYGALCAMAQSDFKRLVAYSSVSHMGFVLLGIALIDLAGIQGAMFQIISHGITSAMMFFLVGVLYDRVHHRDINRMGGIALVMPVYTGLAILGFFAGMGLPGLCGFIGEIYVLMATWKAGILGPLGAKVLAVIAASGMVLTAGYILWTIQRVYLGPVKPEYANLPRITAREIAVLAPLGVLSILLGVLPAQSLFNFMNGTLANIFDLLVVTLQ